MTTADQITVTPTGSLSSTDVQAALQELDAEKAAAAFDAAGTDLAAATLQDAVRQTWQIADLAHHKLTDRADALATRIDDAETRMAQAKTFDPAGTGLDTTDPDRALRQTWQVADLAHHKLAEPSGVAPGTYGGGNAAPVLTVDERGRVTGAAATPITPAAIGAAEAGHAHDDNEVTSLSWSKLTGAPSSFPPSAHVHDATEITGLSGSIAHLDAEQTFSKTNRFIYTGSSKDNLFVSHCDSGSPIDFSRYRSPLILYMRSDADARNYPENNEDPMAIFFYDVYGSANGPFDASGTPDNPLDDVATDTGGIYPGMWVVANKHGNGSAHCITTGAGLWETNPANTAAGWDGPPGYNEVGLFQGIARNYNSEYGLLEGIGLHLFDEGRPTKMTGAVFDLVRTSGSTDTGRFPSACMMLQSSGTSPVDQAIKISQNPANTGYGFLMGIDFRGANYNFGTIVQKERQNFRMESPLGAFTMGISENGALQIQTASNHTNMSLKVMGPTHRDQNNLPIPSFQVAVASDSPIYLMVDGVLKQVTQGDFNSAGTNYRLLRVPN